VRLELVVEPQVLRVALLVETLPQIRVAVAVDHVALTLLEVMVVAVLLLSVPSRLLLLLVLLPRVEPLRRIRVTAQTE
jgi:hypothetical protein